MSYLIKNATVYNKNGSWHLKNCDILIRRGKIEKIADYIGEKDVKVIEGDNLVVSAGFMDIGTTLSEPGYEDLDTIKSLCASASVGGFTSLAVFPNTNPTIDNKGAVETVKFRSAGELVTLYPIGALTSGTKGEEISEMEDMIAGGAVAFSDGKNSVQHAGVLKRALRYLSNKQALIINHPNDKTLSETGIMNESVNSSFLGLKGIPGLAEEIMLNRDIKLSDYTESDLLVHLISTKESVRLVKKAKQKESRVYASVSFHNLVRTDDALRDFDPMHKVLPPLRGKNDMASLVRGLLDDTIDCIVSNHVPVDIEDKRKAFLYAGFGSLGLEQMFSVLYTQLKDKISLELLLDKLCIGPRKILGLPEVRIEEGEDAEITIIDTGTSWTFDKKSIRSGCSNAAFLGEELEAKIVGVIANKKVHLNA
jgi:dihydroorotase